MNKKPVSYFQTDTRWKNEPYRTSAEKSTVGSAGCGPSCAAMLIETLTGKTFTPLDACKWSMNHGYKATGQGTYYSYFTPQFKEFGIDCKMLNTSSIYGKTTSSVHQEAFDLLKQGYYLIACMGKGLWTSAGHFVVVWGQDGKVRINDPSSSKDERVNGDLKTFKSQVKYYWAIDARKYNSEQEKIESPIKEIQKILNSKYGANIKVDGIFGSASKKALIKAFQKEINLNCKGNLKVDGYWGVKTKKACPMLQKGAKGDLVWILQAALCAKYKIINTDGIFGATTLSTVKGYQKDNSLKVDGIVGAATWESLLG